MVRVKVGRNRQIAVPAAILEQLGVQPGDHMLLEVQDGHLVLEPEPHTAEQQEPTPALPASHWAAPLVGAMADIMTDDEIDAYWAGILALRHQTMPRPV